MFKCYGLQGINTVTLLDMTKQFFCSGERANVVMKAVLQILTKPFEKQ